MAVQLHCKESATLGRRCRGATQRAGPPCARRDGPPRGASPRGRVRGDTRDELGSGARSEWRESAVAGFRGCLRLGDAPISSPRPWCVSQVRLEHAAGTNTPPSNGLHAGTVSRLSHSGVAECSFSAAIPEAPSTRQRCHRQLLASPWTAGWTVGTDTCGQGQEGLTLLLLTFHWPGLGHMVPNLRAREDGKCSLSKCPCTGHGVMNTKHRLQIRGAGLTGQTYFSPSRPCGSVAGCLPKFIAQ